MMTWLKDDHQRRTGIPRPDKWSARPSYRILRVLHISSETRKGVINEVGGPEMCQKLHQMASLMIRFDFPPAALLSISKSCRFQS